MSYFQIPSRCSKEHFIETVERIIKDAEDIMAHKESRRVEYENVIWGMHRVLNLLDVEIRENNHII